MIAFKKIFNHIHTFYLGTVYPDISIGKDGIIDYRTEIESKNNIVVGAKSILYKHVTLYKKPQGTFTMGCGSHIAPYGYFLLGDRNLRIGDDVAIGPFCSFFCTTNTPAAAPGILHKQSYQTGDIEIGNNVFIGAHCVILPGTVIENDVAVAANSTLKGVLKSGWLYGGNPIRAIRELHG
jgi:acetyltransferase-like isoleucine patch superfamily enzyme